MTNRELNMLVRVVAAILFLPCGTILAQGTEAHERMGSGTSWQPEDSPVFGFHWNTGAWSVMAHGLAFGMYDRQSGPRGHSSGAAPNWVMAMAQRPLGEGELGLRTMLSLDPVTLPARGYPELFQTGETFGGRPLVDAQHPHDFFMELGALYTRPLAERIALQVYGAPVGEPALGPVAFPHRTSSMGMPVAVLGHHLQDSTHITFGVATLGLILRDVKIEGSAFNGSEPDEQRWDFDTIRLNSFAGRISYAPSRHWVVQISRGRLDSPEELLLGEDLTRTTASALYTTSKERGFLAAGLVWGRNDEEHHSEDGVGVEATWAYADKNELFGRFERVDRRGLIDVSDPDSGPQVQVSALSLGAGRDIATLGRMPLSLGGLFTVYDKDEILDPVYGENPVSFYAYLRLRPPRAHAGMHSPMAGHHDHGAAHP